MLPPLERVTLLGGSKPLISWQPDPLPATVTSLDATNNKSPETAFVATNKIGGAIGFPEVKDQNDALRTLGFFLDLIDPNAIHDLSDKADAALRTVQLKQMSKAERHALEEQEITDRKKRLDDLAAQTGGRIKPVDGWRENESAMMEQAFQTLGLPPGASEAQFLAALRQRASSPLGQAVMNLSAEFGRHGLERAEHAIRLERFSALGAFLLPGFRLVLLGADGKPHGEGLIGMARVEAAGRRERAIEESRARAAGKGQPAKVVTLSAAHANLTGLDRAIAAHVLNPDS